MFSVPSSIINEVILATVLLLMIILKCVSQLLDFIRHVTYSSIFRFMDTLREFEFRQQIHIMTSNYVIVAQLSYA